MSIYLCFIQNINFKFTTVGKELVVHFAITGINTKANGKEECRTYLQNVFNIILDNYVRKKLTFETPKKIFATSYDNIRNIANI